MTNSKNTKKKLTGSILALVLCFVMLLGTTFAWFTDTASTNVSKIQAGNLDVALEYATAWDDDNNPTKWENAEGKTLQFRTADGRTENILWEPGSEYWLPDLRIKNNGDLALKFKLDIKGIGGDEKLNEAITWASIEGSYGEDGETTLGWNNVSDESYESVTDAEFYLEPGKTADIMLGGYMKKDAGNEYQGLSIDGVAITVLATQYTYESDSNDNQYDKDATYAAANIDDLRDAVANGGNISLGKDIVVPEDELLEAAKGEPAMLVITKDTVIDLNGKNLEYTNGGTCYYGFFVTNGATLTIKDSSGNNSGRVYANDPEGAWAVYVSEGHADIYGGSFKTANGCCIYKNKGTINIYGGKFETDANASVLLNLGNSYRSYGPINVYGGSFKNFEPGVTNGDENKVADGYKVVKNGDWYDVVAK